MKTVHYSATPIGSRHPQKISAVLIATTEWRGTEQRVRVELNWDTSYSFQTSGTLALFSNGKFERLQTLHHHDLKLLAEYDAKAPQDRGDIQRAGKLPQLVKQQTYDLAKLAITLAGCDEIGTLREHHLAVLERQRQEDRFKLGDGVIEDALNAAVLVVQKHIGVTDGGIAGQFFAGQFFMFGEKRDAFAALLQEYADVERANSEDASFIFGEPTIVPLEPSAANVVLAIFDALPEGDDEWGSERQIAAQNKAFAMAEQFGVCVDSFETTKETTHEMLARLAKLVMEKN